MLLAIRSRFITRVPFLFQLGYAWNGSFTCGAAFLASSSPSLSLSSRPTATQSVLRRAGMSCSNPRINDDRRRALFPGAENARRYAFLTSLGAVSRPPVDGLRGGSNIDLGRSRKDDRSISSRFCVRGFSYASKRSRGTGSGLQDVCNCSPTLNNLKIRPCLLQVTVIGNFITPIHLLKLITEEVLLLFENARFGAQTLGISLQIVPMRQ
jgi:hypothetical protein